MATQKDPTIFGYQNFYSTTLTGDITSGTLTIGLATVPTPTSGILVIEPDSTSAREVILYTSKGASTITCPSDGRGWSGSTAAPHLQGSTVIMAPVDEWFKGLADGTLSTDPMRTALFPNSVISGGVAAQSSGLIGTLSNVVFYLNGQRYTATSIPNKTYTASKDTYVDITATSGGGTSITYTEVANGAATPAVAANYVRLAKVVTNGSAITLCVSDGGGAPGTFRGAAYFKNATQSIPGSTDTLVALDTLEYNSGLTFANNAIYVNKTGKWLCTVSGTFQNAVSGHRAFLVRVNGASRTIARMNNTGGDWVGVPAGRTMDLSIGDRVEFWVFQNSGGAINLNGGGASSPPGSDGARLEVIFQG